MVKNKQDEMEILQAMLHLLSLSLYDLGVGNYAKVNQINFIGDYELWIGDNVICL